ncbi:MAG TPA: YbdK family carboxylate-amine ligase [Solirubrobacterales bacterium]|jgi:carboxylate-amine ligase|nr:YbdK family carboxylate-amine ligase [Solirubrobacterales bacterium]
MGSGDERRDAWVDLDRVRERFEDSTDFTVGLEEEFAIVDPATLDLEHRFEQLHRACLRDELLAESARGELIDTEIEITSGRGESFAQAAEMQCERRARLFAIAESQGLALAATGTHPWANYLEQRIIDTEHYNRLREELRWVAQRNNTWSLHVHVGVRGADRAIAVCDWMRELLPPLLAASANSPFLDHRDTGLHSVRTEIFTRVFPRCGVHEPFRSWGEYARFVELLKRTGSIAEPTQLWWSVRPHHAFGTVEVRICDAQTRGEESLNLAALITACVAQTAIDFDERGYEGGGATAPLRQREIEENLWRAIRWGLDGEMLDFRDEARVIPTRRMLEEIAAWTAPARAQLGLELEVPDRNGAQRARAAAAEGRPIEEIYRHAVEETRRSYAPRLAAVVDD